jgi:hypothetical protein
MAIYQHALKICLKCGKHIGKRHEDRCNLQHQHKKTGKRHSA